MPSIPTIKTKWYFLIDIITATLFLLLVSHTTSPLYRYCSGDSSIFVLIGKAITEGKIVYKDIFDHKGPVLFFIEALGQSIIAGRSGVFLLQIINLTFILYYIRKTAMLFISPGKVWIVVSAALLLLLASVGDGNVCEEYNLLFSIISFYYALKFFLNPAATGHPLKHSFIYGLCFALIAFNRLNDVVTIGTACLTIFIFLCYRKNWKNLSLNILMFLAGFICVCIPIFVYFYFYDAIHDMIYATFLFNFKYAAQGTIDIKRIIWIALDIVLTIFLILNAFLYYKKNKNKFLFLFIALGSLFLSFTVNCIGVNSPHYYVMIAPFLCLAISLWLQNNQTWSKNHKIILNTLLFTTLSLIFAYAGFRSWRLYKTYTMKDIPVFNYPDYPIPDSEKNSVIAYMTPSNWYLENNILPCYKYFTFQEWWGSFDPQVLADFNAMMEQDPPLWIIVTKRKINNPKLEKILIESYQPVSSSENREFISGLWHYERYGFTLYKRKSNKNTSQ